MSVARTGLIALALALVVAASPGGAAAQPQPPPAKGSPDDILGTVEVDGSGGRASLPPLPKLAIVPLPSTTLADSLVSLVVRRDLELSGQYQVLDVAKAPPGPFTRDLPLDLAAFAATGAEYVVRTYAEVAGKKTRLVAEAFLPPRAGETTSAGDAGAPSAAPAPAYRGTLEADSAQIRPTIHRLVDALLGALTGRAGGFASRLTYVGRVGQWRSAYVVDADGFDLHTESPSGATVLSPAFGPNDVLFYGISSDYSPFHLAAGKKGTTFPFTLPGSLLGLAYSSDRTRVALTLMSEARSSLWLSEGGQLRQLPTAPNANHPAFGPLGKLAYAGGTPVQRIYIDGKPVSPASLMASAPAFCDAPEGLLVLFSVRVGAGADLVAMDTAGGSIHRLTQRQGSNDYPACSPDGRLVAFFSSTNTGKGAGLYLMPVARPWLAQKISSEVGEALRWERTLAR
jgi:TolB protein